MFWGRNWCWCWVWVTSFCLRISSTLRWELECLVSTKVGLAAGRYSGTRRPDLYLTPQALQSVFGPNGPVLHCGVLSVAQWRHFLPSLLLLLGTWWILLSFFFQVEDFTVLFFSELEIIIPDSDDDDIVSIEESGVVVLGDTTSKREAQFPGAIRDRLLRALAGTGISGLNIVLEAADARFGSGMNWWISESVPLLIPCIICILCISLLENDSSTKFDSHSSSAKSSYCF